MSNTVTVFGGYAGFTADPTVLAPSGTPAYKLVYNPANPSRQEIAAAVPIKPGDKVLFQMWIKTGQASNPSNNNNPYAGGRIGVDYYTTIPDRIAGSAQPNGGTDNSAQTYILWSNNEGVMVMDFTVPSTVTADGELYPAQGYPKGQVVVPLNIVPWLQVWSDINAGTDGGSVWFGDAFLSVNGNVVFGTVVQPQTPPATPTEPTTPTTPTTPTQSGYCWILQALGYTNAQIQTIRAKAHTVIPADILENYLVPLYTQYGQEIANSLKMQPALIAYLKTQLDALLNTIEN